MSSTPPPYFPLPADWHDQVRGKLNKILQAPANCLACGAPGAGKVFMASHVVSPVTMDPGPALNITGNTYPTVLLICGYCGFTRGFNYNILMGNPVAP